MADEAYVIRFNDNTGFCVGVEQAIEGQIVTLQPFKGKGPVPPTTQWIVDPVTGLFTSVANRQLCLDISGNPANDVQLVLATPQLGRTLQSWTWKSDTGRIVNNGAPTYFVTDLDCKAKSGNPVTLHDSSAQCQTWTLLQVDMLEGASGGQRHEAGVGDD